MSKPKWTPGPWPVVREDLRGGCYWCGVVIPGLEEGFALHADDNGEANAHLIAAAPDLYDALHKIIEGSVTVAASPDTVSAIEDLMELFRTIGQPALAKARGEP
jgi:hypothetical protein